MKRIFTTVTFLLSIFLCTSSVAQITSASQWTWMKGDNTAEAPGVYGTRGVAAAANKPGARDLSVSWTDTAGNLWLFGGYYSPYGFNSTDQTNDLWKYNPATNQWTWINGSGTPLLHGIYGTQGIPNATNSPGSRQSSVTWTDTAGDFWLFGGYVYDSLSYFNDLWKYKPATNQWTWMNGSNTTGQLGTYGTMGIASATSRPGSRISGATWTDATGNLWLFGGSVSSVPLSGFFNDLWKYNPANNQWAWMSGSTTADQQATYGTLGVAAASNQPGPRAICARWKDNAGNFWLFGGAYYAGPPSNRYSAFRNDLWKYNPGTAQWTWVKGDSTNNLPGVYGTMGTPATVNQPGARQVTASWADTAGNFWLFGGYFYGYLNDLWKLGNVPPPNLTINDVNHFEGNGGTTTYSFTVRLSAPAPAGGVTFDIATAPGTATAGSDYISKSLTSQTIPAGNSTYTFDVMVAGDTVFEPNETFFVNVANVSGAVLTDGEGLGTLSNDDASNNTVTTTTPWTWMKGDNTTGATGIYGT